MAKEKILIVDDEESILELLRYNLEKNGYRVDTADTGEDAIAAARASHPDLVILDLMLPGIDGLEVCKILKNDPNTSRVPILMLTAKGEDADIVTGLELGADDYVTKPFSINVLIARVRALLRAKAEAASDAPAVVKVDDLVIDPARHEVLLRGKGIDLTHAEFNLLHLLAGHPGRVFTRQQIINSLWGEEKPVTDRSVDVQVVGLRRKLGACGKHINTVRGVGYKYRDKGDK